MPRLGSTDLASWRSISEERVGELSRPKVKEAVLAECYAARDEGRWRGGGSGYPMVEAPGEWIDFATYGECNAAYAVQQHNLTTSAETTGGGGRSFAVLSILTT